jgi:hypothetical protein
MTTTNEAPTESSGNPLLDSLYASVEQPRKESTEPTRGMSLHAALASPDKPAEKPDDKPPEKAQDAAEKPAEKPAAAAPSKRVKVRRASEPVAAPAAAPAPAPAPAAQPEAPTKDDEEGLLDEEKDKVRIARYAAKKNPTKYADHDKKLVAYFKKHSEFITKKQAEDPDYDFSDDNPEYKAFQIANRPPAISAFEERALEREMIKDEAVAEADKRISADREERRIAELKPKLKKQADQFWHEVVTTSLPDELMATIRTHGAAKARELHPLEYEVADHVSKSAAGAMQEFLELASGVKQFDRNNGQHIGIAQFIEDECKIFQDGGNDLVRDGKRFVTRADFHSMPAAQRAGFWTFSDADLIGRAKLATKFSIQQHIKAESDRRAAQGWSRPQTAPAKPQEPTASSAARPAPAAGNAPDSGSGTGGGNVAMSLLGY